MTAGEELTRQLIDLAANGGRPRCGDPGDDRWTSDDPTDRAEAAALCAGCLVLDACRAAADEADERWHVWAGVDRTPKTRTPMRKKANT